MCRVEVRVYDEDRGLYLVAVYINERLFETKVLHEDELEYYGLSKEDAI